jgi:cytochrome P450 family 110
MSGASLPPGPTLDTAAWREVERNQLSSLQEFFASYGPIFTVRREGTRPRVYVAEPDAVRDIFVLHAANLEAQGTSLFKPLVGADSVAFLNGHRHREARRVLRHALHLEDPQERLRMMVTVVSAEASQVPVGAGLPLQDFANDVTRRIIVTLLFGEMPQSWSRSLLDGLGTAMACLHDRQAAVLASANHDVKEFSVKFDRVRDDLDRILYRRLALHRNSPEIPCVTVLDHLTGASTVAGGLSDREIIGYLKTLLVSGHETTSASLAWALCHLASRPDVRAQLRRELDASDEIIDPSKYLTLPYLRAVCLETLRCSSPVPNGGARKVVREFSSGGYAFPPDVEIVPCICVMHQREDIFPQATVFDPQRFVDRSYRGDEYLPFGIGSRRCPGATLALQELTVALAVIITRPGIHLEVPTDALGGMFIGPTVRVPRSAILRRITSLANKAP